ncbi:beta strand repeat-containing protein, partial [Spirochaetota bacterium]
VDHSAPYADISNIPTYIADTYVFSGSNFDTVSGIQSTVLGISNTNGIVTNLSANIGTYPLWDASWDATNGAINDGEYFAYITATNKAGLGYTSSSTPFIVNNEAPILYETNIGQHATNAGQVTFKGYATNIFTGIDPPAVYFRTNGGTNKLVTNSTSFERAYNTDGYVPDGTNLFIFTAVSSNARTNEYVITNIVDNSIPYAEVTNNAGGSVIASRSVNISGTNAENWSRITANVLLTNGGIYAWTNVDPWIFIVDSSIFSNGLLELAIVVSNSVDLVYTNYWTNYVSNVSPTVAITNPPANTWLTVSNVTFSGFSSNEVGEVSGVYFGTNENSFGLASGTTNWSTNVDLTQLQNSTNVFYVIASNEFGWVTSNAQTNYIDLSPPELTFREAYANTVMLAITNIKGSAFDLFTGVLDPVFTIATNGAVIDAFALTITGTSNWNTNINTANYVNGYYDFMLQASNIAGLVSVITQTNIYFSNDAGLMVTVTPTDYEYITGITTLSGYIVPGSFMPKSSYMSNAGTAGWRALTMPTGTAWNTNYNTTNLSDGTNFFRFMFINSNDYTNDIATNYFIIDNSAPVASITNLQVYISGIFTFRGTNYDPHSGIENTVFYVTNTNGLVTNLSANIGASPLWDISWNTTNGMVSDGEYFAYLITSNGAGLGYTSGPISFIVNNEVPIIVETNIRQYATNRGEITFGGYATNIFSGIDPPAVYFRTNGGTNEFVTNSTSWEKAFDTGSLPDGTNYYYFYAVSSNNRTNEYTVTNISENTAPAVTVSPSNDITTNQAFTLSLRVDDNNGFWSTNGASNFIQFTTIGTNITISIDRTIFYYGKDALGNTSTTNSNTYTFAAFPAIAITNPATNIWLTNTSVSFSGWASNAYGTLTGVYFSTSNTGFSLASGTINWYTNTLDISGLADSTNVFYVIASNDDGYCTTNLQTNYIDFTAPGLAITNPTNAMISNTVSFAGTNYDSFASITGFWYSTNTNGQSGPWLAAPNSNAWTIPINTTSFSNGEFIFGVKSSNEAGLVSYMYVTNYISNQELDITFISPTKFTWVTSVTIITGSVSSKYGHITELGFSDDGSNWGSPAGDTSNW